METLINVYGITSVQRDETELSIQFGRAETAVILEFGSSEAAGDALDSIVTALTDGPAALIIESIS